MATPLVVIVGPTGSGKSALALELAERYDGEIICADSRTVYKGMNIGTAKPSDEERARVKHHLLDVIEPNEKYNVAEFKKSALRLIEDIANRGKLSIMVGGTGLYIDAVLYDYDFNSDGQERDQQNPRHWKQTENTSELKVLRNDTLIIGLSLSKEELEQRLNKRVENMIRDGLEEEVKILSQKYGWEVEAMTGVGYREWQAYFEVTQSIEETKQLIITHSLQYAKRQRTWFKRNESVQWFQDETSALACAENWLIENKSNGQNNIITRAA